MQGRAGQVRAVQGKAGERRIVQVRTGQGRERRAGLVNILDNPL